MRNSRFASSVLAALLLLALPGFAEAQDMRTISGEVVSGDTQGPLPGVQVTVKGTRIGTITDANGRFTLRVPADATTLVLTNLGYRTREVAIEEDGPMTLTLQPEAIGLEGLVVTALGVQRERRRSPLQKDSSAPMVGRIGSMDTPVRRGGSVV